MPDFQSGIYRHYNNGSLYFASQVRLNHTSGEWIVCYDALYPNAEGGYWKPINEFGEMMHKSNEPSVPRFVLVQELPAEAGQMLLPGKSLYQQYATAITFVVVEVKEEQGKIIVVSNRIDTNDNYQVELELFLNLYRTV